MSAVSVCLDCRKQKRKCDRIRPECSKCKRLNKKCVYPLPAEAPRLLPVPEWPDIKPSNLRYTLEHQVSKIVGDGRQLQEAAALYFRTIHTWFPIVSERDYYSRYSKIRVDVEAAPAEFSLLTLSMALVCKAPVAEGISDSARSLYVSFKGCMSLLETAGENSLEMIQSRLLLTVFEIGHAIHPSGYISAAANVRAAMSLGLDSMCKNKDLEKRKEAENVRHALLILDSYVSLESGQVSFIPRSQTSMVRTRESARREQQMGDWPDGEVNSFMKLARASQLLEQVLIHVHASVTAPNDHHNRLEGMEIIKSLTSFMTTFQIGDVIPHPLSDSALAISRSAMLEALKVASHMDAQENFHCISTSVNILNSLVREMGIAAKLHSPVNAAAFSIFLPHCLFKAAMLCLSDDRVSGGADLVSTIQPLGALLDRLGMRWVAARQYLQKIDDAVKEKLSRRTGRYGA